MYDTQSQLGSAYSFRERDSFIYQAQPNSNVKYFDLKDLIDNTEANEDSISHANQTFSNLDINSSLTSKYIPKQSPTPKLINSAQTIYSDFQTLSKLENENNGNIFYPSNAVNNSQSSVTSYSSMSHISRPNSVNEFASNNSVKSVSTSSNRLESPDPSAWSNSEYISIPPAKLAPKFENLTEISVEEPKKIAEKIKIITDPDEIRNIDMDDPSYMLFEISEVYSIDRFGSFEDFFYSNGFQYGIRDMLEYGEYEISEIIFIF
jgi:hypothetical protein